MSATAKKEAARGGGGEISDEDSEESLTPQDLEEFDSDNEPDEPDEPEEDETDFESLPLPQFTEEDDKGDWVYTLQYATRNKVPFTKVRIPKNIYAKDIRRSTQGRNEGEVVFFMLCSMSKVPAKHMDLVDARDYTVLQMLLQRRALGNSRAVLRSIAGGG